MEYFFDLNSYNNYNNTNKHIEIGKIIGRFADEHTSIYYRDILAFIGDHPDLVENDINEFGWNGNLYKHAQSAEYEYIVGYLTENLYDFIVEYLKDKFGDLTEHQIDLIASNFGISDTLYQLDYQAEEFLSFEEEE